MPQMDREISKYRTWCTSTTTSGLYFSIGPLRRGYLFGGCFLNSRSFKSSLITKCFHPRPATPPGYLKPQKHLFSGRWFQPYPSGKIMDFVSWDDELFPIDMGKSHNPAMFQSPPTSFFTCQPAIQFSTPMPHPASLRARSHPKQYQRAPLRFPRLVPVFGLESKAGVVG